MLPIVNLEEALARLANRRRAQPAEGVAGILDDIRARGGEGVRDWAARLDSHPPDTPFEVDPATAQSALDGLDPPVRAALETAAGRIRAMAERQRALFADLSLDLDGVELGHRVVPIERAAVYAPGGRYPLPSTVLMGVIPARVAGVAEVIVLSPRLQPVTLAAAVLAGADRVFDLGGAHGVAAAAWGLAGVPRVDLLVGPGNRYVTEAKRQLYGEMGIDFPAGPSELLILAEPPGGDPAWLAADLLGQAEHDPDALAILASPDRALLQATAESVERQLAGLPVDSPAHQSLAAGLLIELTDLDQAVTLADWMAPEHLELVGAGPERLAGRLRNYGSLFLGPWSAEVFGDYISGPNHILPTAGAARFTGGLWVGTFLKVLTWQRVRPAGLPALAAAADTLARAEGLTAHARSATIRLAGLPAPEPTAD